MDDKLTTKIAQLQKQIDELNEEIPSQFAKKIQLYCEMLMVIGRLHSMAVFDYKKAYAERKNAHGMLLAYTEGTGDVKKGQAEVGSYEARIHEAKAEADMTRWKNAYDSTSELIQAMKKSLDVLRDEMRGA